MNSNPEKSALVEAMSWSNANMYLEGSDFRTNNSIDHDFAADLLRGLEHIGWKLVKNDH